MSGFVICTLHRSRIQLANDRVCMSTPCIACGREAKCVENFSKKIFGDDVPLSVYEASAYF